MPVLTLVLTILALLSPATTSVEFTAANLPACVEEDGSGGPIPCYWDASTRGNGQGTSLVFLGDNAWIYLAE